MIINPRTHFRLSFALAACIALAMELGSVAADRASVDKVQPPEAGSPPEPNVVSPSGGVAWTWSKLDIFPPNVKLETSSDFQNVIAVATRSDGITQDVTDEVTWEISNAKIARLQQGRLIPATSGATKLKVHWNALQCEIEVQVDRAEERSAISFQLDIMPIITRAGCNTGSCHGAARGKDGFRLSLFGFDPAGDYQRITREIGIRRINLARPDQSLVLLKATGSVQHSGGKKIQADSVHYATLLKWLSEGAPNDPAPPPTVTSVDIYPQQAVMEGESNHQKLVLVANYSDGSTRDVSDVASFSTNNERTAAVDTSGTITSGVRGEAFVMARFDTHTVGAQVLALPRQLAYQAKGSSNIYIDEMVQSKLKKLRISPSQPCSDEEFIRRATIDIVGMLPTEQEFIDFGQDDSPDKRAKKVNQLLERKEFSEIWAMKWAELLMIKSTNQVSYKSAFLYNSWLTNEIAANTPINQIVMKILASEGGVFEKPETNFFQIETDTLKTSENVAQIFMGIRTQCAQCHNHPFDRWTMDDYYGFAAFFSQIGRKTGEDYRETIVFNRGSGDVKHPVTGAIAAPKYLGGPRATLASGEDRRKSLAQWITSDSNPNFSMSIANRVWAHFMGVGIVHPVDDFRVSNPASNPELLQELGKRLIRYEFDLKQLVRDICTSETYQRSSLCTSDNENDLRNFSHAMVRRIPAESLLDCISQATQTKDKFRGLPEGARAVQIADGTTSNYFLNTFGRSARTTVCSCEASTDPSLSQAMHLLNGTATQGKIAQGKLIDRWTQEGLSPTQIIEHIFLRCLSRKPTDVEIDKLMKIAGQSPKLSEGLEDIFWATLNSREFIFNH